MTNEEYKICAELIEEYDHAYPTRERDRLRGSKYNYRILSSPKVDAVIQYIRNQCAEQDAKIEF